MFVLRYGHTITVPRCLGTWPAAAIEIVVASRRPPSIQLRLGGREVRAEGLRNDDDERAVIDALVQLTS